MSVLDGVFASRLGVCSPFATPLVCFAVSRPVAETVVVKKVEAAEVEPPCGTESLVRRLCRKCLNKPATMVVECNGKTACLRGILNDVGRDFVQIQLLGGEPILVPLDNVCAIQCGTSNGTLCDFFHSDPPAAE